MEGDKQQQSFARKKMPSRVFHCVLAVIFFVLMIISIVSLSTFAAKHNEIRDEVHDHNAGDEVGTCILFASYDKHRDYDLQLGHGHTCGFAIWGEAIVALVAALLMGTSIAKAVAGLKA